MKHSKSRIILASGSIYRRQLLSKLQVDFDWQSPDVDETVQAGETPETLVKRLSISKARAVAAQYTHSNSLVIGSDQVAVLNGQILGKPLHHARAVEQLQQCSGESVAFLTGLCVIDCKTDAVVYSTELFTVTFRELSPAQIENYLLSDKPYDCAGSFKAEGLGVALFSRMEGKDPNSLIGLPLIQLVNFLEAFGYPII